MHTTRNKKGSVDSSPDAKVVRVYFKPDDVVWLFADLVRAMTHRGPDGRVGFDLDVSDAGIANEPEAGSSGGGATTPRIGTFRVEGWRPVSNRHGRKKAVCEATPTVAISARLGLNALATLMHDGPRVSRGTHPVRISLI